MKRSVLGSSRSRAVQASFWLAVVLIGCIGFAGCRPAPRVKPRASSTTTAQTETPDAPVEPGVAVAGAVDGTKLYRLHCAACHGADGNGLGLAATFLYPKPRDFRTGKYRLVSTANRVPSAADLEGVLVRGMPGSSMPPWNHLPPEERQALVGEVVRLWQEGTKAQQIALLKSQEDLTDEEIAADDVQAEIRQAVARKTTAGEASPVPESVADAAAVLRGKDLYMKQGCNKCHGDTGRGDGVQKMIDDEGFVMRPRDLTRGIYKGGTDVASVYRRIAVGMPGTPMPSSSQILSAEQMADLTHYVLAMSDEATRDAAVLKRRSLAVTAAKALPADAAAWEGVPATTVQTTPLWWRDDPDPQLRVQAVHDGETLALRLTWHDASHSDRAVRPEEFEDLAAVELFQGAAEPFLGMGAEGAALDLWQWRAGVKNTGAEDSLFDEYPFDTAIYRELAGGKDLPDFVTARVAGNPIAQRDRAGSSLSAKGFGSLTFRPAASQVVKAEGTWRDGQWTVVLTRPLRVPTGEGLTLQPGSRGSIAFALWDGAARDRAGQKRVSIWNDLEVK